MPGKLMTQAHTDFWKFWTGQAISNLGSSFTGFALPLLIFKLTYSPLNLAFTSALNILPHLLFGLFIGAWADRVNRKGLMIFTDIARALVIALLPLLALTNLLTVWWIYVATFVNATLSIFFETCEFAAISSLVDQDNLVQANGRIQASYSTATILGPLLAGVLTAVLPLPQLLFIDALSFLISAGSLLLIATSFNANADQAAFSDKEAKSVFSDMLEGMRYIWNHSLLRTIVMMLTLTNFLTITPAAQLVAFAKQRFHASDVQVGLLYAAGGAGVIVLSLISNRLWQRFSFVKLALGSLTLSGLMILCMALTRWYWTTLPLWALFSGLGTLFNIIIYSLVQTIVPNKLLGRAISFGRTLAWLAVPLGALAGGLAIEQIKNIALIYVVIGVLNILIPLVFSFMIANRVEPYLHPDDMGPTTIIP